MLPKNNRVSRIDLKSIEKSDIYSSNNLFSLRSTNKDMTTSKISFSVSKKVSKSAVIRNKLRRYGYRAAKSFISKIKNRIVIVYFKKIPKDFAEVDKSLEDLLIGSKIIN